MTELSSVAVKTVAQAVESHLDNRTVEQVEDRGVWIRHSFRVTLDGGEIVYLKLDQSFPGSEKEAYICELLRANGLPAPRVLGVDTTCALLPAPFIVQAHVGGERLGDLLDRVGPAEKESIYAALGRFYRHLHAIHHDHSGWIQGAGEVLPFSPNQHQYDEVIVRIGGEAVERGVMTASTHGRLKRLWADSIGWLDEHQPSLVGGTLPWTVYLARNGDWHVTKLMDLHDYLYWDPAWDLVSIRYPAFREPLLDTLWETFVAEYGSVPGERRLKLYLLMQRIDAAMGNYMAPPALGHQGWRERTWQTFDHLLAEVEGL